MAISLRTTFTTEKFQYSLFVLSILRNSVDSYLKYGLEAVLHRCSYKRVFWKYAANLQEKTHAEVQCQ